MSIVVRRREKKLALDKSAWFLCRFLCRDLNDDNYEKMRDHVSTCKGVKTRLRLSEKGVEIGYKPNHVRHYHHKIKYELLPLETTENMFQDVVFVNVLLCVFHIQNLPGLEYEIVAFKFLDSNTVKRFQDVCNILLGGMSQARAAYGAPGKSGNMTLMPSKAYHVGSLAPEKWGSVANMSDGSYGIKSGRGNYGYGAIVPGNEVQRRGLAVSNRNRQFDPDDENDVTTMQTTPNRSKHYVYDGQAIDDAEENNGGRWMTTTRSSSYPNYLRAESGSVVSAQSSSAVFDDDVDHMIQNNGVSLTYSLNRPRNNNITLKSMEVTGSGRYDKGMTSSTHRLFKKKQPDEAGDLNYLKTRSQSVEQFPGRRIPSSSRSDIYQQQDAMSVRSQTSYYLVPSFKKVYARRSGQTVSPESAAFSPNTRPPLLYDGSIIRGN